MHGLVNRALQCLLIDTYGVGRWTSIAHAAMVDTSGFEAMLVYDDAITETVLAAASNELRKPVEDLLEDMGTYLVSHSNMGRVRRLLRFGGDGFEDFLHSLDDVPGRARLAVPDLVIPAMILSDLGEGRYSLECRARPAWLCHIVLGALRTMADDYGALAFVEFAADRKPKDNDRCQIDITLLSVDFSAGRSFELSEVSQ